jgi:hypothetical protein
VHTLEEINRTDLWVNVDSPCNTFMILPTYTHAFCKLTGVGLCICMSNEGTVTSSTHRNLVIHYFASVTKVENFLTNSHLCLKFRLSINRLIIFPFYLCVMANNNGFTE